MSVRIWGKIAAAFILTACLAAPAKATIYTFVDESGVVHFTNVPSDPKYQPVTRPRRPKALALTADGRYLIPGRSGEWAQDTDSFDEAIRSAGSRYQVDPRLVKSVIRAESNFDYLAVSRKGALGLMQLMPETCDDLQVQDPFDPFENIEGGTRYLRKMLGMFKGDLELALAAYNAGPNRVIKLGGVPKFKETKDYIRRVQHFYDEYKEQSSPHKRWAKNIYDGNS